MKKIVLISNHPEESEMVKYIPILFPECEIKIVASMREIDGCAPDTVDPDPGIHFFE
jgi:hypothetical protein